MITDFTEYRCGPATPINDVLRRIEASRQLFQIVTDEAGRLLGTVTDGDVRRAILRGAALNDPVSEAMQTKPTTGRMGEDQANTMKMNLIGSSRSFLPLLDDDGIVRAILVDVPGDAIGCALVMAGGLGTRLGERTKSTPKPLLEIGGRKILDHVIASLEDVGVNKIIVSVHYLADQIVSYVEERDNQADIELLREERRLGTAGALGLIGNTAPSGPLLVVNGDVISSIDYKALYEYHNRHGYDGTIAVARYDVDVPFGIIRQSEDGVFEGVDEKPRISNFIAAGIYHLSAEYRSLVPRDTPMEMPDLLNLGRKAGLKAGLFPLHEYWTDVGNPRDLDEADRTAEKRKTK